MTKKFIEVREDSLYTGPGNETIAREYGQTPNGNNLNGRWVLRDATGAWIDYDQYRYDLAERHDIRLEKI